MPCQIKNKSDFNISEIEDLIQDLYSFSQERHGFQNPVILKLESDETNTSALGKTAHYDPSTMEIVIYVDGRHPKDIMRSFSHELIHHNQNEAGMFDKPCDTTDQGYAQSNPHLRKMEKEAYLKGNMCFRDWEDGYKTSNPNILNERRIYKMSINEWKNKELNGLLNEKWGFSMDLGKLNENKKPDFADLNADGDKEESMEDAAEDAKQENEEEQTLEEAEDATEVIEEEANTEADDTDEDTDSDEDKEQEIEQILDDSDATEDIDESTMEQIVAAIESLTLGELQDLVKAKEVTEEN
jgi:hypothetical protein